MTKNDVITLSDGQIATIVKTNNIYNNIYVVKLSDGQLRVVDRETLTLAPAKL